MMQDYASKAQALAQENMRLEQENILLRAMQENARLVHENMILRMQSQKLAPPGLELQVSPMPHSQLSSHTIPAKRSKPARLGTQLKLKNQATGNLKPLSGDQHRKSSTHSDTSEESTIAGSSPPYSQHTSKEPSEADQNSPRIPALSDRTSVMMKNVPNSYTRKMLLDLLETEGHAGTFDFVYLPMDFKSNLGLGYAFIDFTSPEEAKRFSEHFMGFNRWTTTGSDKVCEVAYSQLQGLEAHIERYRNSPVMHKSVPEDHKPLLFAGTEPAPLPAPTKDVRAPRQWNRRRTR